MPIPVLSGTLAVGFNACIIIVIGFDLKFRQYHNNDTKNDSSKNVMKSPSRKLLVENFDKMPGREGFRYEANVQKVYLPKSDFQTPSYTTDAELP